MGDDLVPGQANRPLSLEVVEAPIELRLLRFAQRESFRVAPERFPESIEEIELLLTTELADVQRRGTHGRNVAQNRVAGQRGGSPVDAILILESKLFVSERRGARGPSALLALLEIIERELRRPVTHDSLIDTYAVASLFEPKV